MKRLKFIVSRKLCWEEWLLCVNVTFILQEHPCDHPIIILDGVGWREVVSLLHFMYCGEVVVEEDHLGNLLNAASNLGVTGLSHVSSAIVSTQVHNIMFHCWMSTSVQWEPQVIPESSSYPAPAGICRLRISVVSCCLRLFLKSSPN